MSEQPNDSVADEQEEAWRNITGFVGYEVSNLGRVRTRRPKNGKGPLMDNWRPLKISRKKKGHCFVLLSTGVKQKSKARHVHRLVLEAFVGPCPPGMTARHVFTNDPGDNRLENLAWGTPAQNSADQERHGTRLCGSRSPSAKLTEDQVIEMRRLWTVGGMSQTALAERFGITRGTVWAICHGRWWRHLPVLAPTSATRFVNRRKKPARPRDEAGRLLPGPNGKKLRSR